MTAKPIATQQAYPIVFILTKSKYWKIINERLAFELLGPTRTVEK